MAVDTTQYQEYLTETVREQAEKQADTARRELGDRVVDAVEDYFPEAVRQRRRRDMAIGVVAGAAAGFVIGKALGRR